MRKQLPIILSSLALVFSVMSFFNTLNTDYDSLIIKRLLNLEDQNEDNRIIPKISISLQIPDFDLPSIIRNDSDCIKALIADQKNTNLIDNQSTFITCSKLLSLSQSKSKEKFKILLLSNGMLSNLQDLSLTLQSETDRFTLKLIDLSDNIIRTDSTGDSINNAVALKDILKHVDQYQGALIIIGNPITRDKELLEALAEIHPQLFLRLIWMPESFFTKDSYWFSYNKWIIKYLSTLFPRFRIPYIEMIVQSHKKFYDWTHTLDELQREELHHLY